MDKQDEPVPETANNSAQLIDTFCEITSSSRAEASFFLESHQWELDAAVSTFLDSAASAAAAADEDEHPVPAIPTIPTLSSSQSAPESASQSQSDSPSRSRSPSPSSASRAPYNLRSKQPVADLGPKRRREAGGGLRAGGVRTLADLNRRVRDGSDSDSDGPSEYYTGGEKSGMLVQDPSKDNDVDAIFDQASRSGAVGPAEVLNPSSSSKSFTGTARLLSGETLSASPQLPEAVNHTITFWRDGFSVDDGPLRRLDDPGNAPFLESIRKSECPQELEPADRRMAVHVNLMRRDENYPEPVKSRIPFQGVGRTLGSSSNTSSEAPVATIAVTSLNTAPLPSVGLVVDETLPSTSIQLRLADGTRMVSRFNYHHTICDIHAFIDASRPGGARSYQLQTVGFPPKLLTDLNQTIEQAGLASSVVIQKF